jgi:hypothetical protein
VQSDAPLNSSSIIEQLLSASPYSLSQAAKLPLLLEELRSLTARHRQDCEPYRRILDGLGRGDASAASSLAEIPFLPVRLFKTLKLQSVPDRDVLKVLTSSGTTSQQVSRISLDRPTSMLQTRALASIVTSFIGPKRLPMIIVDSASVLRHRDSMNARGAGLVGLSNFGRDHLYALDEEMRLNLPAIRAFVEKHGAGRILIFGFTFMVWQHFCQELRRLGESLPLNNAILIHSGGWKKLQDQQVSNEQFKEALQQICGIRQVHNFYGMVEQVGSIYMECERGFFHAPNVAQILIRDFHDWSVAPIGQTGLLQTLSALPRSYPGHSLLTEDLATICGMDDCLCGRMGARFNVLGRMPQAELRGCSDTHAFGRGQAGPGVETVRQFLPVPIGTSSIETVCSDELVQRRPMAAFDPLTVDFLDAVSGGILKLPGVKESPELVALAFWLRKASIRGIVDGFRKTVGARELTKPWGVALHIAPSNVDTIFVYSWALAMLAGNINIIRISQSVGFQLEALLGVLQKLMSDPHWRSIAERNVVITYPRDERTSTFISGRADIRVIWGGDETVRSLRSLPAKPRTRDISFADKVSSTVVQAGRYLKCGGETVAAIAKSFYNDAYQFDQLACSSPHFVFFVGTAAECAEASRQFWSRLTQELERRRRDEHASTATDKFVAACDLLARQEGSRWIWGLRSPLPLVLRVPVAGIPACRDRIGGGFFLECFIGELAQLSGVVQPGDQTLGYVEFTRDEMQAAAETLCLRGIDRIVPVGQALAFGPVWDGYVLLSELTRRISVA